MKRTVKLRRTALITVAILSAVLARSAAAGSGTVTLTYDQAGRLQTIQYSDGSSRIYVLDAAGNRTKVTDKGNGTGSCANLVGSQKIACVLPAILSIILQ
jgi:YD repeat-containing protein